MVVFLSCASCVWIYERMPCPVVVGLDVSKIFACLVTSYSWLFLFRCICLRCKPAPASWFLLDYDLLFRACESAFAFLGCWP